MSIELINKLKKDRLIATKNGDEALKTFLGIILGELDRNRGTKDLDDAALTTVINKIRSGAKENIELCKSSNIDASEYNFQLDVLNKYVTEVIMLDIDETRKLVEKVIADGATNIGLIVNHP